MTTYIFDITYEQPAQMVYCITMLKIDSLFQYVSVTRFFKISPFWQSFKSLVQVLIIYLVFGKIWNLNWQKNVFNWANFQCCKWPKFEEIINPSGHTARRPPSLYYFKEENFNK